MSVWWMSVLVVAGALIGLAITRRGKNKRLTVTIHIPERGDPSCQLRPSQPAAYDLSLAVLCYASKVCWLLHSEDAAVADAFRELCGEALDFWNEPGHDLIARMPSATQLRADESVVKAVPGGERYVVALFRTDYASVQNSAWVVNSLPRPGMSANIPWSVVVLLNRAFALLGATDREVLCEALQTWYDVAFAPQPADASKAALNQLFAASLTALNHSVTARERERPLRPN